MSDYVCTALREDACAPDRRPIVPLPSRSRGQALAKGLSSVFRQPLIKPRAEIRSRCAVPFSDPAIAFAIAFPVFAWFPECRTAPCVGGLAYRPHLDLLRLESASRWFFEAMTRLMHSMTMVCPFELHSSTSDRGGAVAIGLPDRICAVPLALPFLPLPN